MPVPHSSVQAPPRRLQRRLGLLGRAESIPIRGPENGLEENSWVSVGFLAVRDGLGEGLGAQPELQQDDCMACMQGSRAARRGWICVPGELDEPQHQQPEQVSEPAGRHGPQEVGQCVEIPNVELVVKVVAEADANEVGGEEGRNNLVGCEGLGWKLPFGGILQQRQDTFPCPVPPAERKEQAFYNSQDMDRTSLGGPVAKTSSSQYRPLMFPPWSGN